MRGKGESEPAGAGGDRIFIENPRRGGLPRRGDGAEGPGGCLGNLGGGGKYCFSGRVLALNSWHMLWHLEWHHFWHQLAMCLIANSDIL